MKPSRILPGGVALLAAFVASCERSDVVDVAAPSEEVEREVRAVGAEAAKALKERLGGTLKGALEAGGPVAAIRVCQQAATGLTADAGGQFEGVEIRRTTLRPRNPANAPDDVDRVVLEEMARAAKKTGAAPAAAVRSFDGLARFYEPLMIQEVCLKCHGKPESFAPELKAALAELYPEDRATGYALGDFRGVIRVEVKR